MEVNAANAFTAKDVADAVFSSMVLRQEILPRAETSNSPDHETLQILIGSIDDGLRAAGLSFAEYLERVRHSHTHTSPRESLAAHRWRYSARERAMQRVDSAVAHLCTLMRQSDAS